MTDQAKKFTRKNYFVLKGFQLRFSVIIFITTIAISLISVWTTYVVTWNEIADHVQSQSFSSKLKAHYDQGVGVGGNIELINSIFTVEFSGVFDKVANSLLLRLLASSLIFFILSIFVSHKIAGPVFRMEKAANSLRKGDISVDLSTLRDGDEFPELAGALHSAILKTRTVINRCHKLSSKQEALTIRLVSKMAEVKYKKDVLEIVEELDDNSKKLSEELAFFKTKQAKKSR